jgi:hypothetical protein
VKVIQAENTDHYRRYLASSSSCDQVILFRVSRYATCASNRRKKTMCDYSLLVYPNRLAVEGDELVVHRFGRASLGLASPSDLRLVINASSCQTTSKKPWSWVAIKKWFLATRPQGQPDKSTPAVSLPPRAKFIEICAEANTYRDRCVSRTAANFYCKLSPRDNESRSCR